MAIIAKNSGGDFINAPAGTHQAVCIDVVDLGIVKTEWQGKTKEQHKIRIVWQLNESMPDGRPFISSRRYTLSLSEMSALRPDLEAWRGRPFTEQELEGFDVETVIGANCLLTIVHEQKGGKTYSNVKSVAALVKGMPKIEPHSGYVRVCDRPKEQQPGGNGPQPDALQDDDIPF